MKLIFKEEKKSNDTWAHGKNRIIACLNIPELLKLFKYVLADSFSRVCHILLKTNSKSCSLCFRLRLPQKRVWVATTIKDLLSFVSH